MAESFKEQRIRRMTSLYYSKPEILDIIYKFSKNREISPRYFEGFGKRPDTFEYSGDVFELVKRGATSFHCSEELWEDPLKLSTGMSEKQLNELRIGWDFLIDIDCKWFDYSKLAAQAIIQVFRNHGINDRNIGVKFSGSKGFHIILPWNSFPKEIAGEETKNLFPELPRKLVSYVGFQAEKIMKESLPDDFYSQFKNTKIKRGIKCNRCREVAQEYDFVNYFCPKCHRQEYKKIIEGQKRDFKCPDCRTQFVIKSSKKIYECKKCKITSEQFPNDFSRNVEVDLFELMGLDLVLVSPRHLFRMPYSLHEKTALSSIVINPKEVENFEPKDADPLKAKIKNFIPETEKGIATELIREALDWLKNNQLKSGTSDEAIKGKYADFKPVKLNNLTEDQFPPSITKILEGVGDGRKRALFVLLNFFRSIGMDKEELEKKIYEWDKKNEVPLKESYIKPQLLWSYRRKPIMPPNFSSDYYKGIGIVPNAEETISKNPVNYTIRKNLQSSKKPRKNKTNS